MFPANDRTAMIEWKKNISFVLVNTADAGNIGSSARAIKNFGFLNLVLVRPRHFPSREAEILAHGAEDILRATRSYDTLGEALRGASLVVGTSRRTGKQRGPVVPIKRAAERIRESAADSSVSILLGREDRGLTNEELALCSFTVRIPASPENPSLNLSHALLLLAYELAAAEYSALAAEPVITMDELEVLFARIQSALTLAGYEAKGIRDSEDEIMARLRQLLARAGLSSREARMLHGVVSQVEAGLTRKGR